jgi:IclR family KDG regulon transcriptional repressor
MGAIDQVVRIVSYLASKKGMHGVTEIARELSVNKTTVYRILSALRRAEWVTRDPETRRYVLGSEVLGFALRLVSGIELREISLPYLYELRDASGETVMLSVRTNLERMYVEQIQGLHEVRQIVELGRQYPIWCGAPGKSMLAHMEKSEQEMILDNLAKSGIHVLASGQIVDIDQLRKELAEIKNQGFSISCGERIPGTVAVAAPLFARYHRILGAISIGGPVHRFNVDLATQFGKRVWEAARKISLLLGDSVEVLGMMNT